MDLQILAMPRKPKSMPTQPHTPEEKPTVAAKGKKRKEMDDSDPGAQREIGSENL